MCVNLNTAGLGYVFSERVKLQNDSVVLATMAFRFPHY